MTAPEPRCAPASDTRRHAAGYRTLVTHVFVAGDEHVGWDAVFGVRESLVADVVREDAGTVPTVLR